MIFSRLIQKCWEGLKTIPANRQFEVRSREENAPKSGAPQSSTVSVRKYESGLGPPAVTQDEYRSVKEVLDAEGRKPLTAAIFGQTGVGKSSLTNALFGTDFEVDDVRPCTKEPQRHQGSDSSGNLVIFWDLPGIGESYDADLRYIDMYADIASRCDVILWAFQADTRSISVDTGALGAIVERLGKDSGTAFLNRISIVVTKADTINSDSWIIARDGETAIVVAGDESIRILNEKSLYFYEGLMSSYRSDVLVRTYLTPGRSGFGKLPSGFRIDEGKGFIYHQGSINERDLEDLLKIYPEMKRRRIYTITRRLSCGILLCEVEI